MIWHKQNIQISDIAPTLKNNMAEFLGLEFTEIGDDFLKMSMPVNEKTTQTYGFLHGGASCVLAETVGSIASAMVIDLEKYYCVGVEINANHLKSVTEGKVCATARPLRLGRTIHVWDIRLEDEKGVLFCISRLTVAIIPGKK